METLSFFRLWFCWAYDSDFHSSQGHKPSHNSTTLTLTLTPLLVKINLKWAGKISQILCHNYFTTHVWDYIYMYVLCTYCKKVLYLYSHMISSYSTKLEHWVKRARYWPLWSSTVYKYSNIAYYSINMKNKTRTTRTCPIDMLPTYMYPQF